MSSDRKLIILPAAVYAVLVGIMWGAYNPHSGMGYETGFEYTSVISNFLSGFVNGGDLLRIHTSTFYNISYWLAKILGVPGSYVPFQVVYAALWWGRGMLVFLILRRFLPAYPLICFLSGALVLVHASDGALQWVGQMNQFGFIFWMLLAFYLLVEAARTKGTALWVIAGLAACFFEQMSLLSYESQLLLLLLFPLTLAGWPMSRRKRALIAAGWYSVPAVYLAFTIARYLHPPASNYQVAVLRKDWSVARLIADWWFNAHASLAFWDWPRQMPERYGYLLAPAAAMALAVGGVAVIRLSRDRQPLLFKTARGWWLLLAAGLAALMLSFPVYLMLDSARGLWRTQFLSGIGSGLTLTAMIGLLSHKLPSQRAKAALLLAGGALVVWFGSMAAIRFGSFHREVWERHRAAMTQVLRLAPSVKPATVVVLTGVPKDRDPFGDDVWFDLALRLSYPGVPVSGIYFYNDGSSAPGNTLRPENGQWRWDGVTGLTPLAGAAPVANTIVIRYEPAGPGNLEDALPALVCQGQCGAESYDPLSRITGPIARSTVRRYRLDAP